MLFIKPKNQQNWQFTKKKGLCAMTFYFQKCAQSTQSVAEVFGARQHHAIEKNKKGWPSIKKIKN